MEFVYVVPRERVFHDRYPQGLTPFRSAEGGLTRDALGEAVRRHGFFVERAVAERTPSWKQIIPYTVVCVGDEILLTRRLDKGGEERLFDKLSIGIGGHINPEDLDGDLPGLAPPTPASSAGTTEEKDLIPRGTASRRHRDPIAAGTRREIEEEIEIRGSYEIEQIGLLNDDSNPVGAVHLGIVQIAKVDGTVAIREYDVLEGRLVASGELHHLLESGANFETWSSILIEHLRELLPAPHSVSI